MHFLCVHLIYKIVSVMIIMLDDGCRRAGLIGDGIFGKYLFLNNPQIKSAGNTHTSSDSAGKFLLM